MMKWIFTDCLGWKAGSLVKGRATASRLAVRGIASIFFDRINRIALKTSPSLMKGWMPKADGVVEKSFVTFVPLCETFRAIAVIRVCSLLH